MAKRLEDMTQADVEEILGPGTPVSPNDRSMDSRRWKCDGCGFIHEFDVPVPFSAPAPCSKCGGIAFEKVASPTH